MKLVFKISVFVLLVSILTIQVYQIFSVKKIVYVNTVKVYSEFKLKKELESDFQKIESARKLILDSLMIDLKAFSSQIELTKGKDKQKIIQFNSLKEMYLTKKKQFEEDNDALAKKYTDDTWNQLNQYISDFGKENKLNMLLGASGDGNLLYAEEGLDVSEELITYVNQKYGASSK